MSRQSARASQGEGVCLLSLDAGGTQNISQLKILAELMHRLNFDLVEDQRLLPCDVFDMIGGSGTGGFVAILLVTFGLTAEKALDEFIEFSVDILEKQGVDATARTTQLKAYVDKLVEKYLMYKDTRLIDSHGHARGCKLVVPILHKGHIGKTFILRNFDAGQGEALNFTITEAILATLASAPRFTPTPISDGVSTYEYISGDLKLSNPIRMILSEAYETLGEEAHVACLLSIGSGQPGVISIPSNSEMENWNQFLEKAIKDSEQKAEEIESQMGHLGIYHRFSVNQELERENDNPRPDAGDIITHAAIYLAGVAISRKVTMCVDLLRLRNGVASLGQLTRSGGQSMIPPTLPSLTRTFMMRMKPWEFIEKAVFGMDDSGDVEGPRMLAVTGMGGCGKTQMIIKFLRVHREKFELCLFVDGSSATNIRADIMRHIRSLDTAHSQKAFDECLLFLSHPSLASQRMIVYDNVDDPDLDLAPLLPTGESCTVIVTSRNRLLGNLCPEFHLELDVMSMEEAIDLLLYSTDRSTLITEQARKDAGATAQALGCLPIALQQARSYMSQTKCSARAYLDRLTDSRGKLLTEPAKFQLDMGAVSTYAAFETSFKKLSVHSQRFLRLLSYFHWSKFPIELIMLAAKYNFSEYRLTYTRQGGDFHEGKTELEDIFLRDGQWSIIHLDKMMIELQIYSLITSVPGVDTVLVEMHPLAHGWVQFCIPEYDVVAYRYAAVLLLALGARSEYTPSAQYLASHVIHLSALWNHLHINDTEAFAHILDNGGALQGALRLRERVLSELRSQAEPESKSIANSMWLLAITYRNLGRHKDAELLQRETRRLKMEIFGERHPDTIMASSNLAITYHDLGRLKEAEGLQQEVLKLRKEVLGDRHPDTIMAFNNLAVTYRDLGRLKEAEGLQEEVLKLRKEILGERHPKTISASSNLALTYFYLGRLKEAGVLQEEILKLRKETLGERHPDTITASNNLALTYRNQARLKEAEGLQEEVLKLRNETLGERHPDTIKASSNLAVTYRDLGRLKEAEMLQEEVLKLMKEILGERHPDTLAAFNNLVITYDKRGKFQEKETLRVDMRRIKKEMLGEQHPETLEASNNLADCYLKLGRLEDAKSLQLVTLRLAEDVLGEEHSTTTLCMLTMAEIYEALDNKVDALKLLDVAEPIVASKLGNNHWQYTELRTVRARVEALVDSPIFATAPTLRTETATIAALPPPSQSVVESSRPGGLRRLVARVRDRVS